MTNLDHIMELRAELASCLSSRERAQIEHELEAALAAQAEAERLQGAALDNLRREVRPA